MTCVLKRLFEGYESDVGARMREYIGESLYTLYLKTEYPCIGGIKVVHVVEHEIVRLSKYNLQDTTIEGESVKNFFKRKYNIDLIHLNIPGFWSKQNQLLVPELCHVSSPLCLD
jgi:hypothetical protein